MRSKLPVDSRPIVELLRSVGYAIFAGSLLLFGFGSCNIIYMGQRGLDECCNIWLLTEKLMYI
uniref:Uncharacterized protein n=1 Tax=Aegilops tauschii subsp. strangulata TaxID=200361 RepID=A0A453G0U4_AEGTS